MSTYSFGEVPRLEFNTYSDAARTALADATTVTLWLTDPSGVETSYTLAGGQVVHDSTGTYHYDVTSTVPGHYRFQWVSTGTATSGAAGDFDVRPKYGLAFVTVDDIRAQIRETSHADDDKIQGYIDAATVVVENIVGPVETATFTEVHDGGGPTICLRRVPVVSVTSVTEYVGLSAYPLTSQPLGSTVDNYGYSLDDPDTGVLTRRSSSGTVMPFLGGRRGVSVTYEAGRTSVPGNIRQAALELIQHLWNRSQVGPAQTFGIPGAPEPGTTMVAGYAVPNAVVEMLAPQQVVPGIA